MTDASTAETLIKVGDIVNIIIAVIAALSLVITIVGVVIAWIPIVLAWWTHKRCSEAEELIKNGKYKNAKELLIVPSIVSMFIVSFIGGLLILVGALVLPEKENGEGAVEKASVIY